MSEKSSIGLKFQTMKIKSTHWPYRNEAPFKKKTTFAWWLEANTFDFAHADGFERVSHV